MLAFAEIKRIPITNVLTRYRVQLRFTGHSATAICPLPSHKQGEKERTFSVRVDENFWRCFSASCNKQNGGRRGGDVIDFVSLMEGCRLKEAAEKLAEWHGIKSAPHLEEHRVPKEHASVRSYKDSNAPSANGKPGYMEGIDAWFDTLVKRSAAEDDATFWKRVRNGVKSKLIESFRNGKSQVAQ
jgi:hypothetical protein